MDTTSSASTLQCDVLIVGAGASGTMLAARSGIWTQEELREGLATVAAYLNDRPGRTWRSSTSKASSSESERKRMPYRLGVDVGGTFTDLLLVHDETGSLHRVKTPSTPADPSQGVLTGVRRVAGEAGAEARTATAAAPERSASSGSPRPSPR